MNPSVVKKIYNARHTFELGKNCIRSPNDAYLLSAANLLQDSVELYLLALADYLDVSIKENTKFDEYFKLIEEKTKNKLLYRTKLLQLNKLRVGSKHHGLQPNRGDLESIELAVEHFFNETCFSITGKHFSTISIIDLLNDTETKDQIIEAHRYMENVDYANCSISCRKAIYLELEKSYDISDYKNISSPPITLEMLKQGAFGLASPITHAPYYARNMKYIEDNVKCPTDYIVYDYGHLNQTLIEYNVDATSFQNLRRMTPDVYRDEKGEWCVKGNFGLFDKNFLADNIQYILDTTTSIVYTIHRAKGSVRVPSYKLLQLSISDKNIRVYSKADKNSTFLETANIGQVDIDVHYLTRGLEDSDLWLFVSFFGSNREHSGPSSGYINENDVPDVKAEINDMRTS